jgi:hypothetical protein
MEGEQPVPEQTVVSEQQEAVTEEQKIEAQPAAVEEKPASDGDKKLENTPENQEQSKYKSLYNLLVSKKIEEVFSVLNKFESESDEKEKKFWNDINELKIPLGDIFDDSK